MAKVAAKRKKAARKRVPAGDRLPNAPLSEVVFELRWELLPDPSGPFPTDPGLAPLIDQFTTRIKAKGFGIAKDMAQHSFVVAHTVARRFYQAEDAPFPLMQVGPGVFATNQDSKYVW